MSDQMFDEDVAAALTAFRHKLDSAGTDKERELSVAFAEAMRAAYRKGWHQGLKDAPSDEW